MSAPSFNLVDRPWLRPVWLRQHDPAKESVGLKDLLEQAHRIRRLVGDTPPQTIALHRLLLAILHRVHPCTSTGEWAQVWKADQLSPGNYLTEHFDRFDLFDAEHPFLQCPRLRALLPAGAAALVPHRATGNNTTLFDHTTADDALTLEPAEAARWLVTLHAFDPGGLKTPYRKGSHRASERGLLNRFGCVLIEGATLKETLLLNLLPYSPEREQPLGTRPNDRPAWEHSSPPGPEHRERFPYGWTDVLTWPSRRVLLHVDEIVGQPENQRVVVDGVVVTPGTTLRRQTMTGESASMLDVEHMAAFGEGPRTYGRKRPIPMTAVLLERHRGVWRHTEELLLPEDEHHQRPHALRELARRVEDGAVDEDAIYTLRVFGQQLDRSGGGTITAWFEQTVAAPVALLRARSEAAGALIGYAVALADGAGSSLVHMERDFRKEMRGVAASALDIGYWPVLPEAFDALLRGLGEALQREVSVELFTEDWATAVERAARNAADKWAGLPRSVRQTKAVARYLDRFHAEIDQLLCRFRGYVPRFPLDGDDE
jgi:CRISPR system Cascade subunit CasA